MSLGRLKLLGGITNFMLAKFKIGRAISEQVRLFTVEVSSELKKFDVGGSEPECNTLHRVRVGSHQV